MGQNVTYSERHDDCGEPVEWHPADHQMPSIPAWAYWFIVIGLGAVLGVAAALAQEHREEQDQIEKDTRITEQFSRMSDSDPVQEAYDRRYPL